VPLGLARIGTYIPERRISQLERAKKFDLDEKFIIENAGVLATSQKEPDEDTADLCEYAFRDLCAQAPVDTRKLGALIVITQNPDLGLPHTAALLHGRLGLPEQCACFDLSLGCSGYVYGLSTLRAFMRENEIEQGLLFTCDPYSKIVDPDDKNTSLLFGDAATVSLLSQEPTWQLGRFTFGTLGAEHAALQVKQGRLSMNGRGIFNFAATRIPKDVARVLELNQVDIEQVDRFLLHPGSRFIVDTLIRRMQLPKHKVAFGIEAYGNTVSSSIPLLLANHVEPEDQTLLLSGFGVGLSWSSTILRRHS